MRIGIAGVGLLSFFLLAGCRDGDREGSTSTVSQEPSRSRYSSDLVSLLIHEPIRVIPGASRGYYLCNILERSLRLWRDKADGEPPLTVSDLTGRGYLLWDLCDLTRVDAASLKTGDGRYSSRLLGNEEGTRERVGVAFACFATAGPKKTPWEGQITYWKEVPSVARENRSDQATSESESQMRLYLSQMRSALALYYFLRNEKATSRSALEQVMGQESPAWKDAALSAVLETLLREHSIAP